MTAPLTPPHHPHRSQDGNPWQAPPNGPVPPSNGYGTGDAPGAPADAQGPGLRAELRDGVLVMVAVALLGIALGLLWAWLAPKVPLISDGQAVFLKDTEGEEAIGSDGTFALLGMAFGVVTAAGVFWFRRKGGVVLVIALALGGLLGSVLAWRAGMWFGPTSDVVAHAKQVGEGVTFAAPLKMKAYPVLLAWPLAAMVSHLVLTAFFGPRDPSPPPPVGWDPSVWDKRPG
ncbi:ABC transporter permease [Streptomyces sp. NPDC051018]|uniref:ABC transporter permease n=1 Tax=Streptomyces sp. NPDC051018 TaxID=3365639 RepID=UPI00378B3EE8